MNHIDEPVRVSAFPHPCACTTLSSPLCSCACASRSMALHGEPGFRSAECASHGNRIVRVYCMCSGLWGSRLAPTCGGRRRQLGSAYSRHDKSASPKPPFAAAAAAAPAAALLTPLTMSLEFGETPSFNPSTVRLSNCGCSVELGRPVEVRTRRTFSSECSRAKYTKYPTGITKAQSQRCTAESSERDSRVSFVE